MGHPHGNPKGIPTPLLRLPANVEQSQKEWVPRNHPIGQMLAIGDWVFPRTWLRKS